VPALSDPEPQQPEQISGRIIAEFDDYSGFLQAMRLRAQQTNIAITSPDMARVSGLPDAFIAKLLSPKAPRRLGMLSMHSVLATLGVKLLMIENPVTTARYTSRLKRREERAIHAGTVYFAVSRNDMRSRQQKGGKNSRRYMTAAAASALARKAVQARWARVAAKRAAAKAAKAAKRRAPAQAKAA
jgi:hypothetical protein